MPAMIRDGGKMWGLMANCTIPKRCSLKVPLRQIEPADRLRRWLHIQPDQFTHTQAAAVEQLHHQLVAHFYPRRFVHTATIAQRLGGANGNRPSCTAASTGRALGRGLAALGARTPSSGLCCMRCVCTSQRNRPRHPERMKRNALAATALAVHRGNPLPDMRSPHQLMSHRHHQRIAATAARLRCKGPPCAPPAAFHAGHAQGRRSPTRHQQVLKR